VTDFPERLDRIDAYLEAIEGRAHRDGPGGRSNAGRAARPEANYEDAWGLMIGRVACFPE